MLLFLNTVLLSVAASSSALSWLGVPSFGESQAPYRSLLVIVTKEGCFSISRLGGGGGGGGGDGERAALGGGGGDGE